MNIVDIVIICVFLISAYRGFKYGLVRSAVSLVGTILVFVLAYYLKNPLSVLMYERLPFFSFNGIFSGITSINIILYEAISYIICLIVLFVLLKVIIKVTGIVDKLINATIIFALPSKLIGLILKVLESYIYVFIILFVCFSIPNLTSYLKTSTVASTIVSKTPILSKTTSDAYNSIMEIYDISIRYEGVSDKTEGDKEAIDVLLKYDVISTDGVKKLVSLEKIKIDGIDDIIEKHEKERNK